MDEDSLLPLELPAVARKKVSLAFDGGRLSSNAGVLLLRETAGSSSGLYHNRPLARIIHERGVFELAGMV